MSAVIRGKSKAIEYLNGKILRTYENGDCEMLLEVMEKEHFWFGTLLSLGSGVEILARNIIRVRVLDAAKKLFLCMKENKAGMQKAIRALCRHGL